MRGWGLEFGVWGLFCWVQGSGFGIGIPALRNKDGRGERVWFGCGSGVVRVWFGGGSGVVRVWFGCGSGVVRGWFGCGSGVVRVWFGCGSGVVRV